MPLSGSEKACSIFFRVRLEKCVTWASSSGQRHLDGAFLFQERTENLLPVREYRCVFHIFL